MRKLVTRKVVLYHHDLERLFGCKIAQATAASLYNEPDPRVTGSNVPITVGVLVTVESYEDKPIPEEAVKS
jgi:hypothetical protein